MKRILVAACCALSAAMTLPVGPVSAQLSEQDGYLYRNPCERGPLPRSRIINNERAGFILFLMEARPGMPVQTAQIIAEQLCDDIDLVGHSDGLTSRLNDLLQRYGY